MCKEKKKRLTPSRNRWEDALYEQSYQFYQEPVLIPLSVYLVWTQLGGSQRRRGLSSRHIRNSIQDMKRVTMKPAAVLQASHNNDVVPLPHLLFSRKTAANATEPMLSMLPFIKASVAEEGESGTSLRHRVSPHPLPIGVKQEILVCSFLP